MANYSELPLYKASYDLFLDIFRFTKEFNKEYKYTIGESLKKETLDLTIIIYRANIKEDKKEILKNAREKIEIIRLIVRLTNDFHQMSIKKFVFLNKRIEKVSKDPISVSMLKVGGEDVIKTLSTKPGPKVGMILNILLELVLNDPKNNKKEILLEEIKKLGDLSEKELLSLSKKAKEEKKKTEKELEDKTKRRYWVK